MIDLFAYGTLMFESVWRIVVGKRFRSEAGVLHGFSIHRIRGEVYPGIVEASAQERVNGLVYRDLDEEAIRRLDAFEGECYFRKLVEVFHGSSGRAQCHAYVVKPDCRHLLSGEPWTAEWFEEQGLASFLREWDSS